MTLHDLPAILFALTALAWAVTGIIKARNGGDATIDVVMCCMFVCVAMLFVGDDEPKPAAAKTAAARTVSAR
jgi:dolichyl-phosphate-mannose--protein O-mannosyl transferase